MAGVTRLELAASCVTGRRSKPTELHPRKTFKDQNYKTTKNQKVVGETGLEPVTSTL